MGARRLRSSYAASATILAFAGWVFLPLAGCDYVLGVHNSGAEKACNLGEKRCGPSGGLQVCSGVGEWTDDEPCASPTPRCIDGACVAVPTIKSVASGGKTTCALQSDGAVFCWGGKGSQQVPLRGDASEIAAARDETGRGCALLVDHSVQCWGDDAAAVAASGCDFGAAPITAAEVKVGPGRTCVLSDKGELYCCGQNTSGETATLYASVVGTPQRATLGDPVTDVVFGVNHTCALAGGKVFCWGKNDLSQCGAPAGQDTRNPYEVRDPLSGNSLNATSLAAGDHHTCAQTSQGVVCWGENSCGQLGVEPCSPPGVDPPKADCADNGPSRTGMCGQGPVLVSGMGNPADTQVLAGAQHTCLWRQPGGLSCWGHDRYWQSLPSAVDKAYVPKTDFLIADRLDQVSIGSYHGCGIRTDGEIWCWGRNNHKQLGDIDKEEGGNGESHEAPGNAKVQAH